jgi:hypothetical protein
MRDRLTTALQTRWDNSLHARAALSPDSPVPLLDQLLAPIRSSISAETKNLAGPTAAQEPAATRENREGREKMISQIPPKTAAGLAARDTIVLTKEHLTWPNTRSDWVELIAHYSNTPELLSDLRRTVDAVTSIMVEDDEPDLSMTAPTDSDCQVTDRLSPGDIDQLVQSFKEGTTIPELVTRYGISRSSVKTLLRQRGVRRRPCPGSSP